MKAKNVIENEFTDEPGVASVRIAYHVKDDINPFAFVDNTVNWHVSKDSMFQQDIVSIAMELDDDSTIYSAYHETLYSRLYDKLGDPEEHGNKDAIILPDKDYLLGG